MFVETELRSEYTELFFVESYIYLCIVYLLEWKFL